jgi:DNA replication protein DnaC
MADGTITPSSTPIQSSRERDIEAAMALVLAAGDHACVKCQDSGYLNDYPIDGHFGFLAWQLRGIPADKILWCDCEIAQARRATYGQVAQGRQQRQLDANFQAAGIPERFLRLTFETLPPRYRKGKEQAIAMARMFLDLGHADPSRISEYDTNLNHSSKRQKPGLCFVGAPGVGKTGILSVAFRERVQRGEAGLWIELYDFFVEIQGEYGKPDGNADGKLKAAREAPLLFLDDCGDPDRRKNGNGIAPETDDRRRILWQLVDYRHGAGLSTLVTSNLSRTDFERQWGTRLAARVWEMCWVIPVGGVDLRAAL